MNKLKVVLLLLVLVTTQLKAQILEPVKWTSSVERVSEDEFILVATAVIERDWHIYSKKVPEGGPVATSLVIEQEEGFSLEGTVLEGEGHTGFDKTFNMEIKYFADKASFKQKIKLSELKNIKIKSFIEFMVCDDTRCLPPEEVDLEFDIDITQKIVAETVVEQGDEENEEKEERRGLFAIFFIAFLSGFAALLTPCVFPMIPMTVSFFTKQSKTKSAGIRNALIFGGAIIGIYVFLGLLVTWIFGASALNALSTNVTFNIIFFLILVIFAASFLGAFEIMLPQKWSDKVDSQADRGGMIGIFFMALALAIVSFSCTGPIVGSLLVEAASKGGIAPVVGMLGFSSALAIPFVLFAAFPGWLNSLPNSGCWLNTVKVVLGFLELALAFKFLSNADLVVQSHLLEREVFLAIWIAIFGALTMYLFGKITLPHDSPMQKISVGRLMLGLLTLTFTIYMIPGLWGAPLKLISAFPPPANYSASPYGGGYTKDVSGFSTQNHEELPEGAHLLAPHDIMYFEDYKTGVAYAKKVGKPIMIDFTGRACVNCRKMEENVWVDSGIMNILKNKVVLISLYVDDKRKLPESEQYISELTGKKIKYIGNKWSEFQTVKYKTNTQPYYVLLDSDENELNKPVSYTPDIEEYYNWMKDGLKKQ